MNGDGEGRCLELISICETGRDEINKNKRESITWKGNGMCKVSINKILRKVNDPRGSGCVENMYRGNRRGKGERGKGVKM